MFNSHVGCPSKDKPGITQLKNFTQALKCTVINDFDFCRG